MTKHNFIAYRDDRPSQAQPITFDGDVWRGYIPLRLPWTLCIRDRVPPNCAAVLINRAHTYSDLALPIDEVQAQVFAAIDGNRTIQDILGGTTNAGDADRARKFVERLWQYDQIVLDATNLC